MVLLAGVAAPAAAQDGEAIQVAVFPAATNDSSLEALANSFGASMVAELRRFGHLQVAAWPALDLPATQLAIGCDDASDDCLRGATALAHTQALLAPSLRITAERALVVSLLYFNTQGEGSRTITRTYAAPAADAQVLDGVPGMLHELLDPPEPPGADREPGDAAKQPGDPGAAEKPGVALPSAPEPQPAASMPGLPILPVILTAAGAVLLGTGAAFGLATEETRREYRGLRPNTIEEINAAADTLRTGRRQAALCNWSLGLGGVLAVTGVTLWILADDNAPAPRDTGRGRGVTRTALLPALSPGSAALWFQHRW